MPNVTCEKPGRGNICTTAQRNGEQLKSVTAELNGILHVLRCNKNADGKKIDFTSECLSDELSIQSELLNELLDLCLRIRAELVG